MLDTKYAGFLETNSGVEAAKFELVSAIIRPHAHILNTDSRGQRSIANTCVSFVVPANSTSAFFSNSLVQLEETYIWHYREILFSPSSSAFWGGSRVARPIRSPMASA